MTSNLNAISLFSGAGGMDVGFEKAGFNIICANEIDANASKTYISNHPSAKMLVGDVNKYLSVIAGYQNIALVFGGPPCQGFSVAGKMNPNDQRSQLIWTFLDVVEKTLPSAFVMENVKALAENSRWRSTVEKFINRAEQLGYDVTYRVLNSADYGVPQKRERVFFVGMRSNKAQTVFDLLLGRKKIPETIREVLTRLPEYGSLDNPVTCTAKIVPASKPILRPTPYKGSLLFNGKGRLLNPDSISGTIPASLGGNNTPIIDEHLLRNPDANDPMLDYHSKLLNGDIPPQVPQTLRRITIKEAAALQTFPNEYVFVGPKSSVYKQIGNAVPCRLAYVVAQAVMDVLQND